MENKLLNRLSLSGSKVRRRARYHDGLGRMPGGERGMVCEKFRGARSFVRLSFCVGI